MTELFSTGIYKKALAYALQAHKEQKTPEGLPYSFHIVSVATEVISSLSQHSISYEEANIAVCCALLHDVNEDTDVRVSYDLDVPNIENVIAGIEALTKDETLPTKQEQMQDSLNRLRQQAKCVQMVKLADRITNLAPAPKFWNKAKRQAYVDEAKMILEALKGSNPYLESKLQSKIDNYRVEGDDNYLIFLGGNYNRKIALTLDKNHPKYLKTFKALNRLNQYIVKEYDIFLFEALDMSDMYTQSKTNDAYAGYEKVGISFITEVLNRKNLLDLNKQTDSTIDKYFTIILDGEECIL